MFFHKIQKHERETEGRVGPKDSTTVGSHGGPLRPFDSCWLIPKCHSVPWLTKAWLLPYGQLLLTMGHLFKA